MERDVDALTRSVADLRTQVSTIDQRLRDYDKDVPAAFAEEFRSTRKVVFDFPIFGWALFASLLANAVFLWIRP